MLHVQCPDCSKVYDVSEELAGKAAKCRECGGRIPIPQLRTDAGSAANRTKSAEPKPASAKPASTASASSSSLKMAKDLPTKPAPTKPSPSKATAAPPAKSKPTAKPKKEITDDDFFEDDFEEIEDYGDVEEVEDFEPTPSRRASRGKQKKKKSGAGFGGLSKGLVALAVSVKSKMSPLLMALLFCFIVGAAGVLQPAIAASAMLACVVCGGLTMAIASLRMVVVTFRINTGWAIFFLFGGLIDMGLTAVGLGFIGALVSLFGLLVSIRLLIENWSEYRGPVHLAVAGFVLIIAGPIVTFLGMAGAGGVAQQGRVNPGVNAPVLQPNVADAPNPAVPKGAELPALPIGNLPQAPSAPRQPSGRVVTFRFQSFGGSGDSTAAARQALKGVAWADLNDLEIDPAKGEIRIGQVGGSVNSEPARQALSAAGFQLLPGVSIGNKSPNVVAAAPPNATSRPNPEAETTPPVTTANAPAKSPPPNTASAKPTPKDTPAAASPPAKTGETQTPRRIVKFRYERFSGKGSSEKAVRDALKRFEWANQEDIVLDPKNHEVRIGLLAESPDFEPARKALSNAGFVLASGVTTATVKD